MNETLKNVHREASEGVKALCQARNALGRVRDALERAALESSPGSEEEHLHLAMVRACGHLREAVCDVPVAVVDCMLADVMTAEPAKSAVGDRRYSTGNEPETELDLAAAVPALG